MNVFSVFLSAIQPVVQHNMLDMTPCWEFMKSHAASRLMFFELWFIFCQVPQLQTPDKQIWLISLPFDT